MDLRADRLAGYRHHLGGDPHRGDALRRPGRPGRHDVTAVQSTRDLGEMLASSFLVSLTAQIGYAGGFLTGSALAVLALLLALRLQAGEGRGEWKGRAEEA